MTTRNPFSRRARLPLAVSLASSLAAPAFGVTFNIGKSGSFDSALSVGASWSTAKPNKNLIGVNNGGKGLSQTSDDSHLNFKRGETFSKVFKGIHDLELKYGDTGVFLRGKYWYDFELKDEHREFKDIDDSGRKTLAKSSGAELLDAFIYHNYAIGDLPGSVRLGKQVVNWGEHLHPERHQRHQPDRRHRLPPARLGDQGRPDPGEHVLPVAEPHRQPVRRRLLPDRVGPDGGRQLWHLLLPAGRGGRWLRPEPGGADQQQGVHQPAQQRARRGWPERYPVALGRGHPGPPRAGPRRSRQRPVRLRPALLRRRTEHRVRRLLHELPQPPADLQRPGRLGQHHGGDQRPRHPPRRDQPGTGRPAAAATAGNSSYFASTRRISACSA